MAEEKKTPTEETENNNSPKKKEDSLAALSYDDEDYDETSEEEEFDAFMAEYRELISHKLSETATIKPEPIEEENPEEVLVTLPKKQSKTKKDVERKNTDSDWDEKITLTPEEYPDPAEDEKEMHEEILEADVITEVDLGEESNLSDDGFQISINFDGDSERAVTNESDESENVKKYDPDNPRVMDWVFDIAEMFVFVLLAVMILTSFVFRHSIVEGPSMMKTLNDGDHLIISDLFYTPERGDIVVFEDYSTPLRKAVIKRVIGLPGDTVEVRLNESREVVVYLNGELLPEEYAFNAKDSDLDPRSFNKPITVGENELYVMGDNRYHSTDSRAESIGTINMDTVLGKVVIRFYPFNKFGTVD